MLNDITDELSTYRAEKLLAFPNGKITEAVIDAMNRISPGAIMGLQGVDADSDGLTRHAWDQAVYAAESVAATVFGYKAVENMTLSDVEPVIFEDAMAYVADRVAESILTLHGYETVRRQVKSNKLLTEALPDGEHVYAVVTLGREGKYERVFVLTGRWPEGRGDEIYTLYRDGQVDWTGHDGREGWHRILRGTGWDHSVREALNELRTS